MLRPLGYSATPILFKPFIAKMLCFNVLPKTFWTQAINIELQARDFHITEIHFS